MKEELLYYVWKFGLTNPNLQTTSNESLQIVQSGTQNYLSGPDFKNSKIRFGEKTWVGNVEIHVKSSDWIKHGHSNDRAYDSIILHVVYENDVELEEHVFRKVPTLELKGFIDSDFIDRYNSFKSQRGWITCESQINEVDSFHKANWLERLKIERIERKTKDLKNTLTSFNGDWERTFLIWFFRGYGFKFNSEPMEWLAKKLSLNMLVNSSNIEALLLGLAGFLPENSNDFYVNQLIKNFEFEKIKWKLEPMEKALWKTGKVRPPNQPVIRIVQLATLLKKCKGRVWTSIMEMEDIKDLKNLFQSPANSFWETHYSFSHPGKKHSSLIGNSSFDLIMINSIIPFLFVYGKVQDKPELCLRALNYLEKGDSQSLLELYNEYCSAKKCLICGIGNKLLK